MKQAITPAETAWKPPKTTPETTPPLQVVKPLTRKQQAFTDYIVDNPKASATAAAEHAYNVTTRHAAEQIAHENMRKPEILLELSKHSQTAEYTLLEVMNTSKGYSKLGNTAGASYATTAIQAANSILDRLHGKATSKVEATSTSVVLNIDLTGVAQNINQ